MKSWGPVLEVWEGYAADPEVRYTGSSGGLASAIALYCIEKGEMHGLLHIGSDEKTPLKNKTVLSVSRDEIVARTGSRYAPASPCDGLSMVAAAPDPCVFIGKPCDVTAVTLARSLRSELAEKMGVTIGIFCAGTPSSQGTLDLLEEGGDRSGDRGGGSLPWKGVAGKILGQDKRRRGPAGSHDVYGFLGLFATISPLSMPSLPRPHQRVC